MMMAQLKAAGFTCVFNLKAGMKGWCLIFATTKRLSLTFLL